MKIVGPTLGNSKEPILYCLDSDESSAIEPESHFSTHSKAADNEYVQNNVAFTLSVLPTTQPHDRIILDHKFKTMIPLLEWYQQIYRALSFNPTKHIEFAPSKNFAPLAKMIAGGKNITTLSTIGFSYLQEQIFPSQGMLDISRKLNAKTSLPGLSSTYGFPIPPTKVLTFHELSMQSLQSLEFPQKAVYLKINGLGGGYHVKKIHTEKELKAFITTHQEKAPDVAAQQELPSDFIEREHIFLIYPEEVKYVYSSVQLTAESSWYGNLFEPEFVLHPSQKTALEKAAHAVRREGYAHPKGFLVGFDSLMNDREIAIIEVNARWLGSFPIYRLLTKLGLPRNALIFSSYDYLLEGDISTYQMFSEKHLFSPDIDRSFSFIPLSFSPYLTQQKQVICFVVVGELDAFYQEVKNTFSPGSFELLSHSMEQVQNKGFIPSLGGSHAR